MTNTFFEKAGDYRAIAAAHLSDFGNMAKAGYEIAYGHIHSLLQKYMLSELFILKMMLISLGVLIGSIFSDFFKKHRKIVIIAFLISVALFVYKVFQMMAEMDEDNDSF